MSDGDDDRARHWELIYTQRPANQRSWTELDPLISLSFVDLIGLPTNAAVIDIGGGASTFADRLLADGYTDVTVLDISPSALNELQIRVKAARPQPASQPKLIASNILEWTPQRTFSLWHDRAVFHFLVDDNERVTYREKLRKSTAPGSHVIIAAFAPTGPESCSGLPVRRYSTSELAAFFAPIASVITTETHIHTTPNTSTQPFSWVLLRR